MNECLYLDCKNFAWECLMCEVYLAYVIRGNENVKFTLLKMILLKVLINFLKNFHKIMSYVNKKV
ncbi:Protein of unknown function [Gryllus bimaculatus]|nr:Protein of unknown function [Gryllus bimaculatus]